MANTIKDERRNTAAHRFYLYRGKVYDTYPFSVCDRGSNPSTLAKFKTEDDANLFLQARRDRYVEQGI